jgi:hypothetical protein
LYIYATVDIAFSRLKGDTLEPHTTVLYIYTTVDIAFCRLKGDTLEPHTTVLHIYTTVDIAFCRLKGDTLEPPSIKNGQSAPDGWTFLEKYDKCSISATPQLLYVKIKDRINMTWFYFAISFMKEVSWFTGLSLSNNINEMYLPKAATA